MIDDTKKYIEVYLDPQNKWNKESKNRQKMDQIRIGYEDVDEIANHIKSLDYYDFLETPYWKAIAEYTKLKASFRCKICNCNHSLATHHRTYENHGYELQKMDDLVVLCKDCHEKFHDIKKE